MNQAVAICVTSQVERGSFQSTLDSVLGQNYAKLDILLADDKTDCNYTQACIDYSAKDSRVKIFECEANTGTALRLKLLMQHSDASFVKCLRCGDTLHPDYIKEAVSIFELNSGVGVVGCRYSVLSEDGVFVRVSESKHPPSKKIAGTQLLKECFVQFNNEIGPLSTLIFRRDSVFQSLDENFVCISDFALWTVLLSYKAFYLIDKNLVSLPYYAEETSFNQQSESLTRLADYVKFIGAADTKVLLQELFGKKRNERMAESVDNAAADFLRTPAIDLTGCLRASDYLAERLTVNELTSTCEAMHQLCVNRSQRADGLKGSVIRRKLMELSATLHSVKNQRLSILNSQSWRISTTLNELKKNILNRSLVVEEVAHSNTFEAKLAEPITLPQMIASHKHDAVHYVTAVTIFVNASAPEEITLRKIKEQTLQSIEIVYFSEDHTDARVTALKKALAQAKGDYICWWDAAEQTLSSTYLERALFLTSTYGAKIVAPARQEKIAQLASDFPSFLLIERSLLSILLAKDLTFAKAIDEALQGSAIALTKESLAHEDVPFQLFQRGLSKQPSSAESIFYSAQYSDTPTIIMVLPFLVDGTEMFFGHLVELLRGVGQSVIIVTTNHANPKLGDSTSWFEGIGCKVYHLPRFCTTEGQMRDFLFSLIERNDKLTLLQMGSDFLYRNLSLIKQNFPRVHVVDQLFNDVGHTNANCFYRRFIDKTIVNSSVLSNTLINKFGAKVSDIAIISHGISIPTLNELTILRADGEKKLPEKFRNKFLVSFFGRFSAEKEPEVFVEICKRLSVYEDVFFIMAGDGPLKEAVKNLIDRHSLQDRIFMPGFVKEVHPLMAMTDVLCLPSSLDGMPLVLMEAQCHSIPIVASSVGSVPMVVLNGENGYLCKIGDIDAFTENISRLYSNANLRRTFGAKARENVCNYYSEKTMTDSYLRLFAELGSPSKR